MRVLDYHMTYAGMVPLAPNDTPVGESRDLGGGFVAVRRQDDRGAGRWEIQDASGRSYGTSATISGATSIANSNIASGQATDDANETNLAMMEMYGNLGQQQMDQSYGLSVQAAERIEQKFPEYRTQSRQSVEQDVPWLNRMITSEFEGALDRLYPAWRTDIIEASGDAQADSVAVTKRFRENVMPRVLQAADEMGMQAMSNASALLRGDIPEDVAAQIKRNAAEIGNQIGVRGQAQGNLAARDLGLTSLQLQEAGLGQSQAALGLGAQAYSLVNQTLQAPVTTGANVTNLMSAYRAPVTDPAAWYQNYVGLISGQGAISPNTVLGTAAQVGTQFAQMGQNQGQFNTQLGQQSYWNQMNYGLQQQAIKASQGGGGFGGALGAVVGGVAGSFGGPTGAMVGAGIGTQVGGSLGF